MPNFITLLAFFQLNSVYKEIICHTCFSFTFSELKKEAYKNKTMKLNCIINGPFNYSKLNYFIYLLKHITFGNRKLENQVESFGLEGIFFLIMN